MKNQIDSKRLYIRAFLDGYYGEFPIPPYPKRTDYQEFRQEYINGYGYGYAQRNKHTYIGGLTSPF